MLKHCNDRIQPRFFSLQPTEHDFLASLPTPASIRLHPDEREHVAMRATQLPLLANSATTGHKLQGTGVDTIFVHAWSYTTNWVYVILSRVKTRLGLLARFPIDRRLNRCFMPQALKNLIKNFQRCQPTCWSDDDYDRLFPNDTNY